MNAIERDAGLSQGYALALEEARRTLDEQERAVAQLSVRAGMLLSAAAITTSFLGAPVLAHGDMRPATALALVAFMAHGATTLPILRPRHEWQFSMHPAPLMALHVEPIDRAPAPPHRIQRELALHMGASADRNRRTLDALTKAFNIASLLLAVEGVAWVVAIVTEG